ncbi:hypothetical protein M513_13054, partial [Trichuris suis]
GKASLCFHCLSISTSTVPMRRTFAPSQPRIPSTTSTFYASQSLPSWSSSPSACSSPNAWLSPSAAWSLPTAWSSCYSWIRSRSACSSATFPSSQRPISLHRTWLRASRWEIYSKAV